LCAPAQSSRWVVELNVTRLRPVTKTRQILIHKGQVVQEFSALGGCICGRQSPRIQPIQGLCKVLSLFLSQVEHISVLPIHGYEFTLGLAHSGG
jgi:hypothetical protein